LSRTRDEMAAWSIVWVRWRGWKNSNDEDLDRENTDVGYSLLRPEQVALLLKQCAEKVVTKRHVKAFETEKDTCSGTKRELIAQLELLNRHL
jgi:hypothetical protein